MKKIAALIALTCLVWSLRAQTAVDLDSEWGGRLSVSIDKKLAKGLHLSLEEEIRMVDNFGAFGRFHTTLGLSYKVHPNIKVGVGYALINPYSSSNGAFKSSRHRGMADVAGSVRLGQWKVSVKERFQATVRTGEMNEYQAPRCALTLKSRLKVAYKGFGRVEPYGYVELRNTLNAPVIAASYDGTHWLTPGLSQYGEAGWFLDGFSGAYVNRWRAAVGAEYRFDKRSSIDLSLMADQVIDRVVDANAAGTRLKSYTEERGFVGWVCAGYNYSF